MPYISSLTSLEEAINNQDLKDGTVIHLARFEQSVIDWSVLFENEPFPASVSIDFGEDPVSEETLSNLIQFIKERKEEAVGLAFYFWGEESLNAEGCALLCNAINGDLPVGFGLYVSATNLEKYGAIRRLIDALHFDAKQASIGVSVNFLNAPISKGNISYLIDALESEVFPPGTIIEIGSAGERAQHQKIFKMNKISACSADKWLNELTLNLDEEKDEKKNELLHRTYAILKKKLTPYLQENKAKIQVTRFFIIKNEYNHIQEFKVAIKTNELTENVTLTLQDMSDFDYLQQILSEVVSPLFVLMLQCDELYLNKQKANLLVTWLEQAPYRGISCRNMTSEVAEVLTRAVTSGRLHARSSYQLSIQNLEKCAHFQTFIESVLSSECAPHFALILLGHTSEDNLKFIKNLLTSKSNQTLSISFGKRNSRDEDLEWIMDQCTASVKPEEELSLTLDLDDQVLKEQARKDSTAIAKEVAWDYRMLVCRKIQAHISTLSTTKQAQRKAALIGLCDKLGDNHNKQLPHTIIAEWKDIYLEQMKRRGVAKYVAFSASSSTEVFIENLQKECKREANRCNYWSGGIALTFYQSAPVFKSNDSLPRNGSSPRIDSSPRTVSRVSMSLSNDSL